MQINSDKKSRFLRCLIFLKFLFKWFDCKNTLLPLGSFWNNLIKANDIDIDS